MHLWSLGLLIGAFATQSDSEETAFAEAIIRYELVTGAIARNSTLCVSIAGRDVPAIFISHLHDAEVRIMVSNAGCDRRIPFGQPKRLKDGTFEVSYGYFTPKCENCPTQGHAMSANLSHDQDGWHVIGVQGGVWL